MTQIGPIETLIGITDEDKALIEQARAEERAKRDAEWLAALAAEYEAAGASEACAELALDNVSERMGLGEQFAARLDVEEKP